MNKQQNFLNSTPSRAIFSVIKARKLVNSLMLSEKMALAHSKDNPNYYLGYPYSKMINRKILRLKNYLNIKH